MKRNYDTIAWFYDQLAKLFFGTSLINAQLFLINAIPENSRILIVGGGTGWILEEISKNHPSGLSITYVDASDRMIALSRQRNTGRNNVTFISSRVESATIEGLYDVAITPFFFDNFSNETLEQICTSVHSHLNSNALWLYCDFQNTASPLQKLLLRFMYLFFRVTCGIEATRLPDAGAIFSKLHYKKRDKKMFLNGFVVAEIYERDNVL
jgi:SAM-dependent methyltransferase